MSECEIVPGVYDSFECLENCEASMSRKNDIFEKLDYADNRFNELSGAVFDAGMHGVEVKFMSTMASDILACSREVFDFCSLDIAEVHIAPHDANVATGLSTGTLKCYFPFYKNQLTKKNGLFYKLKKINKPLHDHLISISSAVEKNKKHPGTLFNYGDLEELADMVNQKKHDKLLKIVASGADTIFSDNGKMKLMIPLAEQRGISYVQLPQDAVHSTGDSYVFEYNKKDVLKFTMNCKNLSRILMDDLYKEFIR